MNTFRDKQKISFPIIASSNVGHIRLQGVAVSPWSVLDTNCKLHHPSKWPKASPEKLISKKILFLTVDDEQVIASIIDEDIIIGGLHCERFTRSQNLYLMHVHEVKAKEMGGTYELATVENAVEGLIIAESGCLMLGFLGVYLSILGQP